MTIIYLSCLCSWEKGLLRDPTPQNQLMDYLISIDNGNIELLFW